MHNDGVMLDKSHVIGTRHIKESREAYDHVLVAAQKYRDALDLVSRASADFGGALEQLSHCKGVPDGLQAAAGLYLLVSNHQQILGDTIDKGFVAPVSAVAEGLQQRTAEVHRQYKTAHISKTAQLRQREVQQRNLARQKSRNLTAYRQSLMDVAREIDDLDALKGTYYNDMWEAHEAAGANLLSHVSSAVRAEVEIHEGVARKGWSGGGLDELIAESGDPFGELVGDLQPIVSRMMGKEGSDDGGNGGWDGHEEDVEGDETEGATTADNTAEDENDGEADTSEPDQVVGHLPLPGLGVVSRAVSRDDSSSVSTETEEREEEPSAKRGAEEEDEGEEENGDDSFYTEPVVDEGKWCSED